MKTRSRFSAFLVLCFLVALIAYLDSPFSFIHKDHSYMTSEPAVAQPVDTEPPSDVPVLEQRLEDVKKIDGYYIEIYQEYEVYYDDKGNVIKREPTSKTESIKYWDKNQ
ncbi:hypothetical protein [Bacillus sp. MRMR6]|uniref:hypothetical protein n=1 Tax=Bacillus sp. MRMR6 TaxID=1928617 RepID=UPI000952DB3A|nr:hypothetical protein [Bacillus sp. MRMR6]OLS38539.1 hypothetical protein BTR25_14040 [Bacillus sp. MRMR6]